jgi:Flp pilus assembly protein TadD
MGDPAGEANTLNCLGEILLALGEPDQARAQHVDALDLARRIGDKDEQARAHDGLACAHQAASELVSARRHWELALALHIELGAPDADRIRAHLS